MNRLKIYNSGFKNGMLILILTTCFLLPTSVFASTVYFSPTSIAVQSGQLVTVTVIVDPQASGSPWDNSKAYTAKIGISFPPNLLSVSSFSQASGWLPLTQPGYDSIVNSSGSIIKTGGIAGGFSSPQTFGTITFIAKSSGIANILVTGATQILNSQSQNTFIGGGQSSVNITQTVQAPATPTQTPPKTSPVRKLMAPAAATTTVAATTTTATTTEISATSSELVAQAGKANYPLALSFIIPFLTFAVGFFLGQKFKF